MKEIFKILGLLALAFFTALMVNITLPYFSLDEHTAFLKIKQWIIHNQVWKTAFFIHVFTSCICLFAGFTQFSQKFLRTAPKIHRLMGWCYVIVILVFSGPSGLIMGIYANGGLTSQTAFVMLSIFWMVFTYKAYRAALRRAFDTHQQYMIRSYALTLSALTLRAWKWIIVLAFRPQPMDAYMLVAWLGWVPNLLIAEWYIRKEWKIKVFPNLLKSVFPVLLSSLLITSCKTKPSTQTINEKIKPDTLSVQPMTISLSDTSFVSLPRYAEGFSFDLKYAVHDNFLKEAVYPCADCMIRKEVADGLIRANQRFKELRFRIKLFDCYRPLSVQKKMWAIFPNRTYVANPATGSIHNRGGAVDITLTNLEGQELDMGTTFDHFGQEAHHAYIELSDTIRANRDLLKSVMEASGFKAISSEWWHYNYYKAKEYPISDFGFDCE